MDGKKQKEHFTVQWQILRKINSQTKFKEQSGNRIQWGWEMERRLERSEKMATDINLGFLVYNFLTVSDLKTPFCK